MGTLLTAEAGAAAPLSIGLAGAGLLLSAIPSKSERQYRRHVKDMGKQLARGEGGLSEGEKQRALAEGVQQIESASAKQTAQLARGSASGQGASGMRQKAIRELGKAKTGAIQASGSAVNQQDLAVRDALKQQYLAGMGQQVNMAQRRRQTALATAQLASKTMGAAGGSLGGDDRDELAEGLGS